MSKKMVMKGVAMAVTLALAGCGGGGDSTTTTSSDSGDTTLTKGFSLPSEISAVPASNSASTRSVAPVSSFGGAVRALTASLLPADSDYANAVSRTYIEEPALEQFDIIEQVLKSVAQTNYADEVGNGPYDAVITWEEDQDGVDVKSLQTWTVQSDMVDGTHPDTGVAQQVNVVKAWIPEVDPETGQEMLIKAQFDIYASANVAADGSFTDYGEWDLNVYFDADPNGVDAADPQGFFAASARTDSNGVTTLKINEQGMYNEFNLVEKRQGILVRSASQGYGKVQYPDWDQCYNPGSGIDCTDPSLTEFPSGSAGYSYNDVYLAVQESGASAVYKDRNLDGAIKMVHRYGVYYADADTTKGIAEGESVEKKLNFGFPVKFQTTALNDPSVQFEAWGFYGAWQGRHELWGAENGVVVDDGTNTNTTATVFTRADVPPGEVAPTYTLAEFAGTFTKRTLADATLNDILGVPVQTWLNNRTDLFNISGEWRYCDGDVDWANYDGVNASTLSCLDRATGTEKTGTGLVQGFDLFDLTSLVLSGTDQRWIFIGGEDRTDPAQPQFKEYVYLDADPQISGFTFSGAGFYEAGNNFDPSTGQSLPNSPAVVLDPAVVPMLSVGINGAIYIQYVGFQDTVNYPTGWVEKGVSEIDPQTGQPVFSGVDTSFSPKQGEEYYINAMGINYIVKRKDVTDTEADYDVKRELQTAATPANTNATATVLPAGTSYLATPWNQDVKYELVADPSDPNYLLLVVQSDATGTSNPGDLAQTQWGLMAYDSNGLPLAVIDGVVTAVTVDEYGFPVDPTQRPVEFNWETPSDAQSWGKQRFLKDANGDYVILDNPVVLNNVAVQDSAGNAMGTLNLQFDGWMQGMPDVYGELAQNDWQMTPEIAGKVLYIAEGTEATGEDGTRYFIKPLDTSLFLGVVTAFPNGSQPDITLADGVDLTTVPSYSAHNMGAVPTGTVVKYTEGNAVE